jgi:PTH1 family peptidyl-tRNA hydrolase
VALILGKSEQPKPAGQSHIRQARPHRPDVKIPETGPMAAMLKRLFGKE